MDRQVAIVSAMMTGSVSLICANHTLIAASSSANSRFATATLATFATVRPSTPSCVADVAGLAVAIPLLRISADRLEPTLPAIRNAPILLALERLNLKLWEPSS